MIYNDSILIILDILRQAIGKDIPGIRFTMENNKIMIGRYGGAFKIVDITPVLSRITGFEADQYGEVIYAIRSNSKGYFNMTPILYLVSNIGTFCNCYKG